jgi:hypothetical protein
MAPPVTIVWTHVTAEERAVLAALGREDGHTVVHLPLAALPPHMTALLAKGAVVFVAANDREASAALALGIDEVLRMGEVDERGLASAVHRARLRAEVRTTRDLGGRGLRGEHRSALSLVAAALGNELTGTLMIASTSSEVLWSALQSVLQTTDEICGWARDSAPLEPLRRLVALRSAAPSSDMLLAAVEQSREAIDRAMHLVRTLREVSYDAGGRATRADLLITELLKILQSYLSSRAALSLEILGPSVAAVSRSELTCLLLAVLAAAVDAITLRGRAPGRIEILVGRHEGCTLVEVHHDGAAIASDLQRSLLHPYFEAGKAQATSDADLRAVRERARQLGGDLLVDSDHDWTTVRLILPVGATEDLVPDLPDGWDHLTARGRRDE